MEMILKVAISKKGNEYVCLGVYKGNQFIVLTFDFNTILNVLDVNAREFYKNYPLGEYKIK